MPNNNNTDPNNPSRSNTPQPDRDRRPPQEVPGQNQTPDNIPAKS